MKPSRNAAFTWVEVLVAASIIVVLAAIAVQLARLTLIRERNYSALSNMKQLHLVTQQMALDATVTSNTLIGWPGDIGGSFSNWTHQIVQGAYLRNEDLCRLLSGPGVFVSPEKIPTANTNATLIYAVKEDSEGSSVFLTSANFTNTPSGGSAPLANAKPYGDKGFVVFRKAGDGAYLLPKQAGNTNFIGSFVPLCQ